MDYYTGRAGVQYILEPAEPVKKCEEKKEEIITLKFSTPSIHVKIESLRWPELSLGSLIT